LHQAVGSIVKGPRLRFEGLDAKKDPKGGKQDPEIIRTDSLTDIAIVMVVVVLVEQVAASAATSMLLWLKKFTFHHDMVAVVAELMKINGLSTS